VESNLLSTQIAILFKHRRQEEWQPTWSTRAKARLACTTSSSNILKNSKYKFSNRTLSRRVNSLKLLPYLVLNKTRSKDQVVLCPYRFPSLPDFRSSKSFFLRSQIQRKILFQ